MNHALFILRAHYWGCSLIHNFSAPIRGKSPVLKLAFRNITCDPTHFSINRNDLGYDYWITTVVQVELSRVKRKENAIDFVCGKLVLLQLRM